MFNLLKLVRYFVYAVFIVSQAITTSVAVWNMSIVQDSAAPSFVASQVDAYLIVIGSAGLLVIFPIIFADILEKSIFFCKVWFELLWVSLYGLLMLIGASLVTSLSTTQLCAPSQYGMRFHSLGRLVASVTQVTPCSSAQVLQVFTWIPAIFVTTYATLLAILSFVRRGDDPAIWSCSVRNFPLQKALHTIKRYSGLPGLPTSSQKSLVIHAPKPRHIIPPLLFCRSARNSAYDAGQPSMSTTAPAREANSSYPSVLRQPLSTAAFYHSSVQKAISSEPGSRPPPPPPPARIPHGTTASPPPLGDWPRLDATSRPRTKRGGGTRPREPPALPPALPRAPQPPPPLSGVSRISTDALASRSRVSPGRARLPGSGHGHRPPPLDLSKISTHQTRSRRHHAS